MRASIATVSLASCDARAHAPHVVTRRARTARSIEADDLREYHEAPPALVRDMEEWLAVGERREDARRVRAWLIDSYALAQPKRARATRKR